MYRMWGICENVNRDCLLDWEGQRFLDGKMSDHQAGHAF